MRLIGLQIRPEIRKCVLYGTQYLHRSVRVDLTE